MKSEINDIENALRVTYKIGNFQVRFNKIHLEKGPWNTSNFPGRTLV